MLRVVCAMMLVMVAQGNKRQVKKAGDESTAMVEECGTAVEYNESTGVCDDVSDEAKLKRNECCHLQGTEPICCKDEATCKELLRGAESVKGKNEASCLALPNTNCEGGCFMVDGSVQSGKTGPMCKPACDAQTHLKNNEDKAQFVADWGNRLKAHEAEGTSTTSKIDWKTIKMVLEDHSSRQSASPVPNTKEDKKFTIIKAAASCKALIKNVISDNRNPPSSLECCGKLCRSVRCFAHGFPCSTETPEFPWSKEFSECLDDCPHGTDPTCQPGCMNELAK